MMTAAQIIDEVKALDPASRDLVREFLVKLDELEDIEDAAAAEGAMDEFVREGGKGIPLEEVMQELS